MSCHTLDTPVTAKAVPARRGSGPLARALDTTVGRGLIQLAAVVASFAAWQAAVDAG